MMIHAKRRVGGVLRFGSGEEVKGPDRVHGRAIGIGVQRQDLLHGRIERQPERVVGGSWAGEIDLLAVISEYAGLELSRGNDRFIFESGAETVPFAVDEEERFVLHDRSSQRGAELISDKRILRIGGGVEVVARGQGVYTVELIGVAVEIVGAAAGNDGDDAAGVVPVLGKEIVGDDAKFLRGIGIQAAHTVGCSRNPGVVIVNAIQQKIVVALALAVDRESAEGIIGDLQGAGSE